MNKEPNSPKSTGVLEFLNESKIWRRNITKDKKGVEKISYYKVIKEKENRPESVEILSLQDDGLLTFATILKEAIPVTIAVSYLRLDSEKFVRTPKFNMFISDSNKPGLMDWGGSSSIPIEEFRDGESTVNRLVYPTEISCSEMIERLESEDLTFMGNPTFIEE